MQCYPADYYTHTDLTSSAEATPGHPPQPPAGRIRQLRDVIRHQVIAAVHDSSPGRKRPRFGTLLAKSRRTRERAFYDRVFDELILRGGNSPRALDVGCGDGTLILALSELGWKVDGVEWDPAAAEIARTVTGHQIWTGDFQHASLPLASYELVVFSHVFEHLPDPEAALRRVRELLVPGGRAVIIVPNPESLGARLFGDAWFGWEIPRHLILLAGRSWASVAPRAGLSQVGCRTSARGAAFMIAHSRYFRAGGRGNNTSAPRIADRLLEQLESWCVMLGGALGEVAIVTLKRPNA